MNKWIFFGVFIMFLQVNSIAQSNAIIKKHTAITTGIVTDPGGEPIIGANILIKGTLKGTTTDEEGRFKLEIKQGETLVISYLGYESREIAYHGETSLAIILEEAPLTLEEVVVTALGVQRERKALGYAIQEVRGEQLRLNRDVNVANSLAGRVAGVQVKQNGTGVGGASRIAIRGANSIAGNNQPLIVVDGVPVDNFSSKTDDYHGNSYIDKGSGIADISPDDIESMTVLKGPAAAALYGSRGGNGVVLITTKTGAAKHRGAGIAYSTNFTFERPMQTPDFQDEYGQGSNGVFNNNVASSWGPKMDGSMKEMALGTLPYSARDNDLYKDFLRTGTSWTNNLELSKSVDGLTFLAGVTRLDNRSAVPNSHFDRTSVNLRATAQLAAWLQADVKVNYINAFSRNRVSLAADPNNVFYDNLYRPRSVAFSDYKPYKAQDWKREDGKPVAYVREHTTAPNNVYWSVYRNGNSDRRDRYISMAALDFTLTKWLTLKLRTGMDNYSFLYDVVRATGNPYWETGGSYRVYTERFKELNTDVLFTAKGRRQEFGIVATAGGNIMERSNTLNNSWSGELEIPDFYAIAAGREHRAEFTRSRKQINSLYATVSLSYADALFLDLTGRNDWSSTLPKKNNSYFYPSVGAGWVFTEMFHDLTPLIFGKLRLSYAEVGNDTDPYMLTNTLGLNYNIKEGTMEVSRHPWRANPNLKNEKLRSWEAGIELHGFDNRLSLDVAFYRKNTYNQILKIAIPPATGYEYELVNAGNIRNQGWEVTLAATPLQYGQLRYETTLNWSTNRNKIVALTENTKRQLLSAGTGLDNILNIVAEEGGSYGDIYGTAFLRDARGNVVIGASGVPIPAQERKKLGNNQPDGMFGWYNTLTFGGLSLAFLLDMNYGGEVWMGSLNVGAANGNLDMTLQGRDGTFVAKGVTTDGAVNTKQVTAQAYWQAVSSITEAFIYDATNARLRELSLSYAVPRRLLAVTPFAELQASLVARNVLMLYSKTHGFDPEAGFSNANGVQGVEFASMPTMRSVGFKLDFRF